jgi:hypothetical protein
MKTPTVVARVKTRTPEDQRARRDQVHLKAIGAGAKLADFSEEEKIELSLLLSVGGKTGFERLLELRRAAYVAHVATMTIPAELQTFAGTMAATFGPLVQMWRQRLPWLEALMVARYGEEPSVWPSAFDSDDVRRAMDWVLRNKWPNGAQRILDGEAGSVRTGLLIGLAVAIVIGALAFDPRLALVLAFGSALTNFWENEFIDHFFRGRSYTVPTDYYIALFTAAPGETGGGTEVAGGSYARVQVATGFANWEGTNGETTNVDSAGTGGNTQNRNTITYAAPTGNWGSISHMAAMDALTSGNMCFYGALATPKTVNNGDPAPSFGAGALDFAFA